MIPYDDGQPTEIVIGLVGAVGGDHEKVMGFIAGRLAKHRYEHQSIKISSEVIPTLSREGKLPKDKFEKIVRLMDLGNQLRLDRNDDGILALATIVKINSGRKTAGKDAYELSRKAYIISSFKRPEEVAHFRNTYSQGFYLFGIYTAPERRKHALVNKGSGMNEENAQKLIDRDENEEDPHGQRTRDTFQLADFFVEDSGDEDQLQNSINRIIDLLFGFPYITPTFDEYAMFQAFSASLRSADLSRQVGAVIAKDSEVLSTGANDCPQVGGGLYWPVYCESQKAVCDLEDGRDYMRGRDPNIEQQQQIFEEISSFVDKRKRRAFLKKLEKSSLASLTEFGRVVHAEMEALLHCARNSISCRGAKLYATTFPCHNCAKHIIAAGISQVVYVEPYPKSKAQIFHRAEITAKPATHKKVVFRPFIGVGPRQFFNLFSVNLSSGRKIKRKTEKGKTMAFNFEESEPRMLLKPYSYLEKERIIAYHLKRQNHEKADSQSNRKSQRKR